MPTVCAIETRIVDSYGNVNIGGNRYSVPYTLIGRQLEVHETKDRIEVYEGHRVVASHSKVLEALGKEGEKKYSASMMPGARTGPASAAKPLTNTLSAKTNLIAATTNRSSTAGVKQ